MCTQVRGTHIDPQTRGLTTDAAAADTDDPHEDSSSEDAEPILNTHPHTLPSHPAAQLHKQNNANIDSDDDDDFMVVKRKHVPGGDDSARSQLATHHDESAHVQQGQQQHDTAAARPKKRKRLKIKPGAVSANRVVFDDEGDTRAPLEMVSAENAAR